MRTDTLAVGVFARLLMHKTTTTLFVISRTWNEEIYIQQETVAMNFEMQRCLRNNRISANVNHASQEITYG